MALPHPSVVPRTLSSLGESPVWDADRGALYWVDIPAGRLRVTTEAGTTDRVMGSPLSAVGLAHDHGLVLAVGREIRLVDGAGQVSTLWTIPPGRPEAKFNDARVDGRGRWWVGSVSTDPKIPTGRLYRVERSEGGVAVTVQAEGLGLSNGIGFSPDSTVLYLTDTAARIVYAYDFDLEHGDISHRRCFVRLDDGGPDGLAVDADGGVWIAVWDGWQVRRYLPSGELDSHIDLPVAQVTGCAFGDDDLQTLYVTTAREEPSTHDLSRQPLAGSLFRVRVGTTGLPSFRFGRSQRSGGIPAGAACLN